MNLDKIWHYRGQIYIALMILLAIMGLFTYLRSIHIPTEEEFLMEYHKLNAHFWPPDIIPHPNLPEPHYPVPGGDPSPWELA